MKKFVYESPEAVVVCLESVDVITTSPGGGAFTDDNMIPDGWLLDENN
jgi:ribosomal protein S27E